MHSHSVVNSVTRSDWVTRPATCTRVRVACAAIYIDMPPEDDAPTITLKVAVV
jgi:hypothetical protein